MEFAATSGLAGGLQSMSLTSRWSLRRRLLWVVGLSTLALGIAPASALARPVHADLSVTAVVTPPYFVPGGRNNVELTIHNAGPDAIDSGMDFSASVVGDQYTITYQPSPYEVLVDAAQGCWAERFVAEWIPPDNDIAVLFLYNYGSLPAGQSLTCTYDIQFAPTTSAPFTLHWEAGTFYPDMNDDPNPSNDAFSYTLNAAPPASATPVPIGSPVTWTLLGALLMTFAVRQRRSIGY